MRFIASIAFLFLVACNYNHAKNETARNPPISQEALSSPDFKTVMSGLIQPKCLRCHSNGGENKSGLKLDTYDLVVRYLPQIEFSMTKSKTKPMPPEGGLTSAQIKLLQNWRANGAPERVDSTTNKPDPDFDNLPNNWSKIRDRVFATKCSVCHSPSGPDGKPQGELDLTDLKQVKDKVLALYNRLFIIRDMPLKPLPRLTPKEENALLDWMNSGMPE